MEPGFYVVRHPSRGSGSRLMIESVPFNADHVGHLFEGTYDTPRDWSRRRAEGWRDFIQSLHPKDDVFVIER